MGEFVRIFDSIYRRAYIWSAKTGGVGEPSSLRACLFVSAAQLINLATIVFFCDAVFGFNVNLSKLMIILLSIALLGTNALIFQARKDKILENTSAQSHENCVASTAYFILSGVLFCVSCVLLYRSAR